MLGAVSMRGAEARLSPAFGVAGRRLSPACGGGRAAVLPSPRPPRRRPFELEKLEKLRELARCDEFSDSESDGVDSDEEGDESRNESEGRGESAEDEDVDFRETVYVPFRRPDQRQAERQAERRASRRLQRMLAALTKGADRASPKVRRDFLDPAARTVPREQLS